MREWYDISQVMGRINVQPRILYPASSHSEFTTNQKFYKQAKAKRIQYHQTGFTTNAKGISLGRKRNTIRNKEITNGQLISKGKHIIKVGNHSHL